MNRAVKRIFFLILMILAMSLFLGLYFLENIQGYYRFKEYCKNEGGMTIYKKIEKNSGFITDDKLAAMSISHVKGVEYARYIEKKEDERKYDVFYEGGNPSSFKSYNVVPSNNELYPSYLWVSTVERLPEELRLTRLKYEIYNAKKTNLFITFKSFSYSIFEKNKTLLASPSGINCHNLEGFFQFTDDLFVN